MSTKVKILGVAASVVASALICGSAQAVTYAGTDTFLGIGQSPNTLVGTHTGMALSSSFSDTWVFQVTPDTAGNSASFTFTPAGGITPFTGTLFLLTGTPTCGVTCTGVTTSTTMATGTLLGTALSWPNVTLAPAYYQIALNGTLNGQTTGYTGIVEFTAPRVPEPATLGLLGIGAMALGMVRRRRAA